MSIVNDKHTPETDSYANADWLTLFRATELTRAESERDEARKQVKELIYIAERAIELAEIDFENDKFGVVSELRDDLKKINEEAK